MDTNKIILVGRLVRDVEIKQIPSRKSVARFSLAVNEGYGEKQSVSFINCQAWEKLAETLNKYTSKGNRILIVGRLKQDSWQNAEGVKVNSTYVVCESVQFLENKKDGNSESVYKNQDVHNEPGNEEDIPF